MMMTWIAAGLAVAIMLLASLLSAHTSRQEQVGVAIVMGAVCAGSFFYAHWHPSDPIYVAGLISLWAFSQALRRLIRRPRK